MKKARKLTCVVLSVMLALNVFCFLGVSVSAETDASTVYVFIPKSVVEKAAWKTPVYCYAYEEVDTATYPKFFNASWPGVEMNYDAKTQAYYCEIPSKTCYKIESIAAAGTGAYVEDSYDLAHSARTRVIICDSNKASNGALAPHQCPGYYGDTTPGFLLNGTSHIYKQLYGTEAQAWETTTMKPGESTEATEAISSSVTQHTTPTTSTQPNDITDPTQGSTVTENTYNPTETYTIKYELCGGEGEIPSQIKTKGIDLKLSNTRPTHTKYTFAYWILSDGKTKYDRSSIYKIDADNTLYAVWKEVCSKCNGTSHIKCDKCNGSKYTSITTCGKCKGDGVLTYTLTCDSCKGTGTISRTSTVICPLCKGKGYRNKDGNFEICYLCSGTGEGQKTVQEDCKKCGGDGKVDNSIKCSNCDGNGKIKTICDKCEGTGENICNKCNGKDSIIYHYPNFDSYVETDPPTSEPITAPTSSYSWITLKSPTCEESGTEFNYITTEIRNIPALGHNFSNEYTLDKTATCTEDGLMSRHCSRCDAHTDEIVIEKRGYHDWYDDIYTKYPTCITEGEKTYYCKNCSQVKTEIIPALGHNIAYDYTIDKAPTCTEDGSQSRHCLRCDAHFDEVVIEKLDHDYDNGRITKQPTCITEGIRTLQCKYCTQTQTEIIPALGHNFSNQYTIDKKPTCTEDGLKSGHCTRCEAHTDEVVIEKHGHHTKIVGKKAATYFAAGYSGDETCTDCGTVITKGKAIAKLKLATPKVKITAGKQKLTVKYTKVKDATGFQVKYIYKGKTKTMTYTSKKSVTKTIKKLKKGSYKVSVRALIKSKGKTAYSNWTTAKKVKVK